MKTDSYLTTPLAAAVPAADADDGAVAELTSDEFDFYIGQSALPVLVDFWAPWCGPCKMVAPVLEALAHEFNGDAVIAKVDVDDEPGLAQRFGIRSIPTMIVFVDGEPVERINGVLPAAVLAAKLRAHAMAGPSGFPRNLPGEWTTLG